MERQTAAFHARKSVPPDPEFETGLSAFLDANHSRDLLREMLARHASGDAPFDNMMRRALWRALCKRFGNGIVIGEQVGFRHIETFELGDGCFIGRGAYIQGRHDGVFKVGRMTWIGPQSYFDARDCELGEYVGWGPGAKVLGAAHVEAGLDVPIISSDLASKPVRIEDWADVGVGAVILPGVTVGRGSIVGAGAVVSKDVPPFAVVAGVPARIVRRRDQTDASRPQEG